MTSLDIVTVAAAHGAWADGAVALMSGNTALHANPRFAAVATINAAAVALARAFAEQGIKDGLQVNSIVPGALVTGRHRSFLERWAPAHYMSDKEALNRFPEQAQISRFEHPEEVADLLASTVRPANEMDGGCFAPHRGRRD